MAYIFVGMAVYQFLLGKAALFHKGGRNDDNYNNSNKYQFLLGKAALYFYSRISLSSMGRVSIPFR